MTHDSSTHGTSPRHWGWQGHRNGTWEIHQTFSNPIAEKMSILNQLRCQFAGMVKIMPTRSLHQNLMEILTSSCNHLTIGCMNCHIATTSSSTKNHQGQEDICHTHFCHLCISNTVRWIHRWEATIIIGHINGMVEVWQEEECHWHNCTMDGTQHHSHRGAK